MKSSTFCLWFRTWMQWRKSCRSRRRFLCYSCHRRHEAWTTGAQRSVTANFASLLYIRHSQRGCFSVSPFPISLFHTSLAFLVPFHHFHFPHRIHFQWFFYSSSPGWKRASLTHLLNCWCPARLDSVPASVTCNKFKIRICEVTNLPARFSSVCGFFWFQVCTWASVQ